MSLSFTPYEQLYDLTAQKQVFKEALNNNNRALAQFLYPTLVAAFKGTNTHYFQPLKDFLLHIAQTIAHRCQLETMSALFEMRCDDLRVLTLNNDQMIQLIRLTNDQTMIHYFLRITPNITLEDLAPHTDDMTESQLAAVNTFFMLARIQPVVRLA